MSNTVPERVANVHDEHPTPWRHEDVPYGGRLIYDDLGGFVAIAVDFEVADLICRTQNRSSHYCDRQD